MFIRMLIMWWSYSPTESGETLAENGVAGWFHQFVMAVSLVCAAVIMSCLLPTRGGGGFEIAARFAGACLCLLNGGV